MPYTDKNGVHHPGKKPGPKKGSHRPHGQSGSGTVVTVTTARKHGQQMYGEGFLDGVKSAFTKGKEIAQKNKLFSRGLNAAADLVPHPLVKGLLKVGADIADKEGYGAIGTGPPKKKKKKKTTTTKKKSTGSGPRVTNLRG